MKLFWMGLALAAATTACGGGGGGNEKPDANLNVPHITKIAWAHDTGCTAAVENGVTITATVSDADTQAASLMFNGSSPDCTGTMTTNPSTGVTCPEVEPYPWTLTVSDPQGNMDTEAFTISPCVDDSKSYP